MTEERPQDEQPQPAKIRVTDKRVVQQGDLEPAGDVGPVDPVVSLRDELDDARRLADERLDALKRMKADYENSRQRMIREQTDIVERASIRIVERLLPVLDDFERALASAREHDADESIVKGVELVLNKLRDVISSEGVERLDADGRPFDPHQHEALSSQPGPVDSPRVLHVVRPGYTFRGRVIRPALVHVESPAPGPVQE